jgi:hypothetical protein
VAFGLFAGWHGKFDPAAGIRWEPFLLDGHVQNASQDAKFLMDRGGLQRTSTNNPSFV